MSAGKVWFGRARRAAGSAGSAGADQAGYFSADDPLASAAGEPVDMTQVRADDALIDALARPNRPMKTDPLDERLTSLLLSWRDDVRADSDEPLVDVETAAAAITAGPRKRGRQTLGPLAAAAAVLVIAFTGVGLAARDAEPGTPLFGVTKVLYSEKAKSVEAAVVVRTKLEAASEALESGRVAEAQAALEQAQQQLTVVAAEDGQRDLVTRTEQLIAQLEQLTPATSTPPSSTQPVVPPPPAPEPTGPTVQQTTDPPPATTTTVLPPATTPPPPPPTGDTTAGQGTPATQGDTAGTGGAGAVETVPNSPSAGSEPGDLSTSGGA